MKESFSEIAEHRSDQIQNLGYDYKGKIFDNTLSKVILSDPTRKSILNKFEAIIFEMIESVKLIKTNYNWTFSKNYKKFN